MKKNFFYAILPGLIILAGLFYVLQNKAHHAESLPQAEQLPQEIILTFDNNQAFEPQTTRVEQGRHVVLKITSNIADELHLHGYDLHTDLEAGVAGEIRFTADKTGRFEFELEDHKAVLGVVEVYPK